MSKIAVVYWSGTGNTEIMAGKVVEGAKAKGAEVDLFTASEFSADKLADYDGLALGCSSMGAEVLEEAEFQPMWDSIKDSISDKKVVLFGSYGWGDGEWMRNWEEEAGSVVVESYICNETPDADAEAACIALGEKLV